VECNNHWFSGRKASEQGWEINKVFNLVNVDHVGLGYFRANVSQKVSARISQSAHNLPRRSRSLLLVIYPSSTQNSRSATKEISITKIKCHINIARMFVAHQHSGIDSIVTQSQMLTISRSGGSSKIVMRG
jgi:hypothetical protein